MYSPEELEKLRQREFTLRCTIDEMATISALVAVLDPMLDRVAAPISRIMLRSVRDKIDQQMPEQIGPIVEELRANRN